MSNSLRDRRREQTAREIQLAALRLSLRAGYGAVTTDSIAAEAGISPRTFFNYYPNKQAAVLGMPPEVNQCDASWIVGSQGSLLDDLVALYGDMLRFKQMDRQVVRMIEQVWDSTPELMAVFRNSLDNIAQIVGGLLQERLGPGRETEAMLVAELATHALSHAVRLWAADETLDEADILRLMRQHLDHVGTLLVEGRTPLDAPEPVN